MKIKVCLTISLALLFPSFGNARNITISAKYRQAANIFVIMDCVSGWWDKTFCTDEGEYQKYWSEHFGLTDEDQALFVRYDSFRKKYYKGLGLPKDDPNPSTDGIFSKKAAITEDLISPVFYSSENLEQAFSNLEKIVSSEDLKFLQEFYKRYESSYTKLLVESEPFKKKALAVEKRLKNKKYAEFFSQIANYYSVTEDMPYTVLFTWWPPLTRDSAYPAGKFLIFQQNPVTQINSQDEDIVFHEIVHTISARQVQSQKQSISKAFLDKCPKIDERFAKGQKNKILEEPLAVAIGQILFLKSFDPKRLHWDSKLYNNAWISSFSKIIFPVIEKEFKEKKRFSVETGKQLGFLCNELLDASEIIKETKNSALSEDIDE